MNDSSQPSKDETGSDVVTVVSDCIAAGREAMEAISGYDQADADTLAQAAAKAIYDETHVESLIDTTIEATGMGARSAKREKLRKRTKGILMDTLDEPTVGEVPCDREGVVEIAKPVGVVGGVVPSTNPAPTTANLAILALNGRNALVVSASPTGQPPVVEAVEYIREALAEIGAPRDLVQTLPGEPSKEKLHALLTRVDLVQVTGSEANVQAGQQSGTPNYCVSAGNPVALVDQNVDLARVAADIVDSAAYDHGTACIAESCAVVLDSQYDLFREHLTSARAYCCKPAETERLRTALFPTGRSEPDRDLIGCAAAELGARAGIDVPSDTTVLVVEPDDIDTDPFVTECLAPVLATIPVADFDTGIEVATKILSREGEGHSIAIHTEDPDTAVTAGRRLDVGRAVVNQPNLGSAGTAENGLPYTLSLGGGTWAGNQFAENLSVDQFIQTTQIAFPTDDFNRTTLPPTRADPGDESLPPADERNDH